LIETSALSLTQAIPPAVAAFSGAAVLGYLMLLPGALQAVRAWSLGLGLLGFGLLGALLGAPGSLPVLIGRSLVLMAVGVIGLGLLSHLEVSLSRRRRDLMLAAAIVLPLAGVVGLLPAVGLTLAADAAIAALALGLSGFCLLRRRTLTGAGLRIMGITFCLAALEAVLRHVPAEGALGALLAPTAATVTAVGLSMGVAVVALRGQQMRAAASEARLRWTEERFDLALRGASDGVWDWSVPTGEILLTNRLREICGIDDPQAVHRPGEMRRYIHEEDWPRYTAAIRDVLDGLADTLNIEYRLPPAPGRGERWVLSRGIALRGPDGTVMRMAGTVTDITERKRFERQLIEAKEEAELASRSKSEFLAHMSHELRTPLNAIIGFSDMMQQEVFGPIGNERYGDYTETINIAGRHLLQLLSDIIDLAKIESGQTKLDDTLCDLEEIAERCERLIASRARENRIALSAEVAPDLPWLRGDAIRIQQILLNLLTNAVKFTPEGGQVALSVTRGSDGGVRCTVRDTGCGIAEKDIPRALARFSQLGSPYVRSQDGMGLGLTLVQMFCDLHQAEFTLDSTPGEGTAAIVDFPAARSRSREGTEAEGSLFGAAPGSAPRSAPRVSRV
jgi:PAS domain S-box-containing protein